MIAHNTLPPPPENPGWNFCHTVQVRFRDIDMFIHANNAAYLTYVEAARVAYYGYLTGIEDPRDFNMTVARAEVDFLKPILFGQNIHVYTRATRIGTKSWTMEHQMRDAETNEIVANATTINVFFNHETGKSAPIPPDVVALIEKHEGRSLRG